MLTSVPSPAPTSARNCCLSPGSLQFSPPSPSIPPIPTSPGALSWASLLLSQMSRSKFCRKSSRHSHPPSLPLLQGLPPLTSASSRVQSRRPVLGTCGTVFPRGVVSSPIPPALPQLSLLRSPYCAGPMGQKEGGLGGASSANDLCPLKRAGEGTTPSL